jgi:lipopolysaccharide export system protein LptA
MHLDIVRSGALAIAFAVSSWSGFARAAAPEAPIQIEADRAELDQNQLLSTYIGKVRIIQGPTEFRGEKVTVTHAKDGLPRQIEVVGDPARFSQPASGDAPAMEAKANRMRYDASSGQMELLGNAWVRQGTDEVTSERLVYDRRNQRILASGESAGGERVRMTIQPRASDEAAP